MGLGGGSVTARPTLSMVATSPTRSFGLYLQGEGAQIRTLRLSKIRNRELARGNLAYVVYTSGSMGKPKEVMVEQGLSNLLGCYTRLLGSGPGDRALPRKKYWRIFEPRCWGMKISGFTTTSSISVDIPQPGIAGTKKVGFLEIACIIMITNRYFAIRKFLRHFI